jgi:uncharacterized membrane protein
MLDKWLLWVHIVAAGGWLGGGFILALLTARARRSDQLERYMGDLAWLGPRMGAPMAIAILGSGIWLVIRSSEYNLGQTWLSISMVLFVVLFVTGFGFHGPQYRRIRAAIAKHGADAPETSRLLLLEYAVGWAEVVLLVIVFWFMVHKPFS